jgi:hypothetical protein
MSVFDVELSADEFPSGLSLRVEDKAEWRSRNEIYSALLKIIFVLRNFSFIVISQQMV